jgi:hypothetical protein
LSISIDGRVAGRTLAGDVRYPGTGCRHDFDFLVGSWNVVNRQLKKHFVVATGTSTPARWQQAFSVDGGTRGKSTGSWNRAEPRCVGMTL